MLKKLALLSFAAAILVAASAQAATTVFVSPSPLLDGTYNVGFEHFTRDNFSVAFDAGYCGEPRWHRFDGAFELRGYLAGTSGLHIVGTARESYWPAPLAGYPAYQATFSAGVGYKWVAKDGFTTHVGVVTPLDRVNPMIAVTLGWSW